MIPTPERPIVARPIVARLFHPQPTVRTGQVLRTLGDKYEVIDEDTGLVLSTGTIIEVDQDALTMDWHNARLQLMLLRRAVRKHRDTRGDDRCYQDDRVLYLMLPEGDTRPERETLVTIENCQHYIECRQGGREYVSPQRRIEELEAEVARLKEFLGDIQWSGCTTGQECLIPMACPSCEADHKVGHFQDCKLNKLVEGT